MERHLLIFGMCLLAYGAMASSDLKSNLAFVIADTETMDEEIEEVTKAVDAIVKSVVKSISSPIEEYILVTFDDEVKLATKTNDNNVLKEKLSDINTAGGGACPLKALTGIELALNESKDGSLVYVFSDASAEDYKQYAKIEALSQRKGIQVVFILTGVCDGNKSSEGYLVYQKIAKATNGQVFHLKDSEIGEILKYVEETIKSRKNILASKTLPAGEEQSFDVTVDGDANELLIAVSGESPSITVTSNGEEVPTTNITKLQDVVVVKLAVEPGAYKVSVDSKSETHVVVSASTSVHFQHGFSTITPSAITDTARRPVPPSYAVKGEIKSYLSIQLGPGGSKVKLHSVKILNMDDSVFLEQPLTPVNKDHFYLTEPFIVPEEMFKIAINGYDTKKAINVTRYSLTPITQQSQTGAINKAPVITVDGAPVIKADFYKPLQLKCRVSAWPRPDVIWELNDNDTSLEIDDQSILELPYDYVRVLNIPKVTKNATYTCSAVSLEGTRQMVNVSVETVETEFIEVQSEDTTIEYQKPGEITCNVLAYPPAKVSWYKPGLGKKPLESNEYWTISPDGATISIKSMEPKLAGSYYCLAKNPVDKKVKPVKVKIHGIGRPKIDKSTYQIRIREGRNESIICKVDSTPNATISWSFKNATTFIHLNETTNTTTLNNTTRTDVGTYTCRAENRYGVDYHGFEVIVEYKPKILKNLTESVTLKPIEGHKVMLNCSADSVPPPKISWVHNYTQIDIDDAHYIFYANGSLGFLAKQEHNGKYTCIADNGIGMDTSSLYVDVILAVSIEAPKKSYIEQNEGSDLVLHCVADGTPQPNITWLYYKADSKEYIVVPHNDATKDLEIKKIQHGQSGEYTCVATNSGGSQNITYIVSVTARPTILNTQKEFKGVLDDVFLRVPCEAIGNPKPDIIWSNATDFLIASGADWYLIGDDGSLIIKNVSKEQEGIYNCTAFNKFGSDSKLFTVFVDEYPTDNFLAILVEQGKSINIPCSVPYKNNTDRIRWFKDGHKISAPVLENVTEADAGNYTCRVSSVDMQAISGTTRLAIGSKPIFTSEAKNITFFYYETAELDCTTTGQPTPTVTWLHDGVLIKGLTVSRYRFVMDQENQKGRYTCIVKNQFSESQRNFYVISE